MMTPRLGPFELTDRIGRGGMGEVWAARHRVEHMPVAIKVITDSRAFNEKFQAAFRNEARAMAGMDHPGIARIHDFGRIEGEVPAGLRAGSPYLVMERLGRPLDLRGLPDWRHLRRVLLELLDALAHAHARGLVHRDLKPDNILWSTDGRRVKLTDFGVAHAIYGATPRAGTARDTGLDWEPAGAAESGMVGTPSYMAPEQVKGQVWAHGPWTDLYALGCLAYEGACGRTPFVDTGRPLAVMMAHIAEPVPPLEPWMDVPEGFAGWLDRLLQKSPEARFRKAADAAWALRQLPEPAPASPRPVDDDLAAYATATADWSEDGLLRAIDAAELGERTEVDSRPPTFVDAALLDTGPLPKAQAGYGDSLVPPMPADWRGDAAEAPEAAADARMQGVGLGLFGLRRVPFVGRQTERDLLWSMLRLVADDGAAQAVVLRGPAGFGKTRLAEWLLERADELGAASALRAQHGAVDGPGQGLSGMLERALRAVQVPADELVGHVRRMLAGIGVDSPADAEALARIVSPGAAPSGTTVGLRLARPEETYAIALRYLERLTAERPVVVLLDDAHYSRRALDFCAYVLDAQARRKSPILLVLTVRDEDLAERPDAAERLAALDARDAVRMGIGPLADDDRPALLAELLGFDDELRRRIDERTGGNAQFAVQLVGDWVQRGVLEAGSGGFRLADGARTTLPDDLAAVWRARVAQVLAGRSAADARALELAATLGLQIGAAEWRAVCAAAGLPADPALVEALLDAALARCGPEGPGVRWAFAHGMLREAILQRAREARRTSLWHRTCARVLARLAGPRTSERVARHLLSAHRPADAVPHLLDAARRRLDEGDYAGADEQLDRWRAAIGALPAPDPRWGRGWLLQSRLSRLRGRMPDAEIRARRALAAAERFGWHALRPAALLEQGIIEKQKGLFAEAEGLLRAAGQAVGDDTALRAACSEELGVTLLRLGARERGVAALEAARAAYAAVDDPLGLGRCLFGLARAHLQAGEPEEARVYNEAARDAFESTGARGAVATCRIMDGELARGEGDLVAAAEHYRAALQLWESIGAANAVYARLNLGFTLVEADRFDEAWGLLESALAEFERQGSRVAMAASRAGLLPIAAASGDFAAFDHHLGGLRRLVEAHELSDVDTARLTEKGAWQALAAGDRRRAGEAAALAASLWTRLGRSDRAAAVGTLVRR